MILCNTYYTYCIAYIYIYIYIYTPVISCNIYHITHVIYIYIHYAGLWKFFYGYTVYIEVKRIARYSITQCKTMTTYWLRGTVPVSDYHRLQYHMNPTPWQKLIGYNALQSLCVWSTIVSIRSLHKYDSMCCMHDTERVPFHVYREMHFPARAT